MTVVWAPYTKVFLFAYVILATHIVPLVVNIIDWVKNLGNGVSGCVDDTNSLSFLHVLSDSVTVTFIRFGSPSVWTLNESLQT